MQKLYKLTNYQWMIYLSINKLRFKAIVNLFRKKIALFIFNNVNLSQLTHNRKLHFNY